MIGTQYILTYFEHFVAPQWLAVIFPGQFCCFCIGGCGYSVFLCGSLSKLSVNPEYPVEDHSLKNLFVVYIKLVLLHNN